MTDANREEVCVETRTDSKGLRTGSQQEPVLSAGSKNLSKNNAEPTVETLIQPASQNDGTSQEGDPKRDREADDSVLDKGHSKKQKLNDDGASSAGEDEIKNDDPDDGGPAPVPPGKVAITCFNDYDVLSGRGGGTNVHPGNRNFRDLINLHRRAYLKARKNDKPAISRAIVRSVRESNGRFLRKDEKSGMWLEIGDDAAREKTSQALRQRAPEMRKLLFDTEREEARAAAEEQLRQQRMMMGMSPEMPNASMYPGMHPGMPMVPGGQPMFPNPALFQAMTNGNKNGMPNIPQMPSMPQMQNGQDPYSQMFSAALLGQGMNRFATNNT